MLTGRLLEKNTNNIYIFLIIYTYQTLTGRLLEKYK